MSLIGICQFAIILNDIRTNGRLLNMSNNEVISPRGVLSSNSSFPSNIQCDIRHRRWKARDVNGGV